MTTEYIYCSERKNIPKLNLKICDDICMGKCEKYHDLKNKIVDIDRRANRKYKRKMNGVK